MVLEKVEVFFLMIDIKKVLEKINVCKFCDRKQDRLPERNVKGYKHALVFHLHKSHSLLKRCKTCINESWTRGLHESQ